MGEVITKTLKNPEINPGKMSFDLFSSPLPLVQFCLWLSYPREPRVCLMPSLYIFLDLFIVHETTGNKTKCNYNR